MRDYSKVSPRFWVGETGRAIRAKGPLAQLIALYLLTCHNSTMLGLYYLPIGTLTAETGIPLEGAQKALRSLSEADFASYDPESQFVFVHEMAAFQIAEDLAPPDKRHKGVLNALEQLKKERFFKDFVLRYKTRFHLPEYACLKETGEPHRRPFDGPSMPGTGTGTGTGTGKGNTVATDDFKLGGQKATLPAHKRITHDAESGKFLGILPVDMRAWQDAYPAVAVPLEIDRAALWLRDNPTKRKKNLARFITNWLSHSQERGGTKV